MLETPLKLRFATVRDHEQLADMAFNVLDEANADRPAVRLLLADLRDGRLPIVDYADFTVIEDTGTGQLVSAMCLMPQTWRYAGISLPVGRPELVMTIPGYRRRGLVRAQFELQHKRSQARGELLLAITGIAAFYRQFGYEMALSMAASRVIYPPEFPQAPKETDIRLRAAVIV